MRGLIPQSVDKLPDLVTLTFDLLRRLLRQLLLNSEFLFRPLQFSRLPVRLP